MANPVIIELPADTWTIVATNVTSGQIKKLSSKPNVYLETYRMTGGSAPTEASDGAAAFVDSDTEAISASSGIDVYIRPVGNIGKIRADL